MRAQNIGSVRAGVSRALHDIMDLRESLVLESAMLMRSIFEGLLGFGFGFGCMAIMDGRVQVELALCPFSSLETTDKRLVRRVRDVSRGKRCMRARSSLSRAEQSGDRILIRIDQMSKNQLKLSSNMTASFPPMIRLSFSTPYPALARVTLLSHTRRVVTHARTHTHPPEQCCG